jgi:hypothetical protein
MDMDREELKYRILETVETAAREVEILGPDGLVYGSFATADIQGLEIALGYTEGRIVYELKLPLEKTEERPYALGVNWDKKVSVGFVTPEVDMEGMRDAMDDAMGSGPPGGGGRDGGGMGGGGRPPGGMSGGRGPESVELWCRVELAARNREDQEPEE